MILFCIPYAGGTENIYYEWKKNSDEELEIITLELKGRGRRYSEPLYNDLDEAVDDIFHMISKKIEDDDYAIYGHSMGSLLAYELYYKILKEKVKEPLHIFFSGYGAPDMEELKELSSELPEKEFMEKIVELGGTPREIIENPQLSQLFFPILKSDIRILEKYQYRDKEEKIKCDISIINGNKDDIPLENILGWRKHVHGKCKYYTLNGDHFFIKENVENITNIIRHSLREAEHVL